MCACVCVFGIAAIVNSEVKFVKLYSPELFAKISFNHTTELCLLCKEFFVFSKKRQRFLLAPHFWILHLIICYNIFIVFVVVGIFVFTYPRVAYKRLVQTGRLLFVKATHKHTHTFPHCCEQAHDFAFACEIYDIINNECDHCRWTRLPGSEESVR